MRLPCDPGFVTTPETPSMEHVAKTITLPNGITLPFVERGGPSGTPVVCLHGISDSWRSFELVLGHLPGDVRLFALSLRGHGDASRPATGYQPEDFAADVAAFMDAMGVSRAVIVGHSMGSYVAQRFAIDRPERTLALVLIGARRNWGRYASIVELADYVCGMTDPVDPGF